jgi:FKBP-type peptidyl-prolyl cis-trans isomerase
MKRWFMCAGLLIVASSLAACGGGAAPVSATVVAPTQAPAGPSAADQGGNLIASPSGLKYEDLIVGAGVSPAPTDMVTVHYTGTLQDGTVFDASRLHGGPISFPLNGVIKGWTEGVGSMKVGGTRKLVIPPELGYGSRAQGPIPANSTLTFIVELLDIPK